MKVNYFPSKLLPQSCSLIITRQSQTNSSQQEILLLNKTSKITYGESIAFPTGLLEKQDLVEKWKRHMPSYFDNTASRYQDFSKRVSAIRSLFEQTGLLIVESINVPNNFQFDSPPPSLLSYQKKFSSDFIAFNKYSGLRPSLHLLNPLQRLGSHLSYYPTSDTQYYSCDISSAFNKD